MPAQSAQLAASFARLRGQAEPSLLAGKLPDGFDATPIEEMLNKRVAAKRNKAYDEADALQEQLLARGVTLNDRMRTWSLQQK